MSKTQKYDMILDALQSLLEQKDIQTSPSVRLPRLPGLEKEASIIIFHPRMPCWKHW